MSCHHRQAVHQNRLGFPWCGPFHQVLKSVFGDASVGQESGGQQSSELFFDQPSGLQFAGASSVMNTVLNLLRAGP